jgi:hypothetical protein
MLILVPEKSGLRLHRDLPVNEPKQLLVLIYTSYPQSTRRCDNDLFRSIPVLLSSLLFN